MHTKVGDSVGAYFDAGVSASLKAFAEFGIDINETAHTFMALNDHVWWMYPGKDVAHVSDRPTHFRMDNENRLHCENGLAIEFIDGTGIAAWHGQTIPNEWVLGNPPSAHEALHWPQMDQRSAACEIIGWHNILDELNAEVIHDSHDPIWGKLVEVDIPDSGKERFLDAICGTGRRFCLPVPPTINTTDEAQSILHGGLPVEILKYCVART
jgi:hypothetical protein